MKFALGFAALLLSVGSAFSADLPMVKPSEPVAPVTPFDWTGPYIGLHAGYGWGHEKDNQSRLFPPAQFTTDSFNVSGFAGGLHGGYNYQLNSFVIGLEGDVDYADIDKSAHAVYLAGTEHRRLELKSDWQGSLRVRAGYAIDRLLLYGTGGVAFADGKLTSSGTEGIIRLPIPTTSSSKTHIGWTAGLGAEYAFTDHWIGRAEVRYSDFDYKTYKTFDGPVKSKWDQVVATLGASYKF
ncbi:porin [Labrys miyagiensis]|uniref:Porin n=1 Tax=Labrys miyagiensis TaxID=346912 RepID=A0ABQ6CDP3_9HYPH|nr:outer membrane protein [Labrys miyagiensis]GLS18483.1 porin [Labrys miyagiensis]